METTVPVPTSHYSILYPFPVSVRIILKVQKSIDGAQVFEEGSRLQAPAFFRDLVELDSREASKNLQSS